MLALQFASSCDNAEIDAPQCLLQRTVLFKHFIEVKIHHCAMLQALEHILDDCRLGCSGLGMAHKRQSCGQCTNVSTTHMHQRIIIDDQVPE